MGNGWIEICRHSSKSKVNEFWLNSFSIFYLLSDAQLKAIYEAYGQFSKKNIEAAIKSETSGSLRRSLLAISKCVGN